jgi:hypothetical protein
MSGMSAWHAIPPWPGDKGKTATGRLGTRRHNQPTQPMQTVFPESSARFFLNVFSVRYSIVTLD